MNYEVNPFQDYESITVDELKDQANSLLNLVTEESRGKSSICEKNPVRYDCCKIRANLSLSCFYCPNVLSL